MITFNENLTIKEAALLYEFKGSTMFPKTKHNIEIMAQVVDANLKRLRNKNQSICTK
jgi:hypothetical protein